MEPLLLFILKFTIIMGYAGIFLMLFLENTIFPIIPSEIFLLFVGILVYLNQFNIVLAIVISTLGAVTGYIVLYYLGKKHMESIVLRCTRFMHIEDQQIHNAKSWFLRNGEKSVFIARFLPGMRHLINFPAGATNMDLKKFILYSAIATAIWNAVFIIIGAYFGKRWGAIFSFVDSAKWILLSIVIVFIVAFIVKKMAVAYWSNKS